ncbi:unnamed protein product, partial [Brassica rapa]
MLSHEAEDCPEALQEREEKAKKDTEDKQKLTLNTRRHENERTERGYQDQRRGLQRSETYNASQPPNPKNSRQIYRPPVERSYNRENRSWKTMEEERYGAKSHSRREDAAGHLRYNHRDSRGTERWVTTGRRFQHSSRASERELLREGERSASHFRNSREDERSFVGSPPVRVLEGSTGAPHADEGRAELPAIREEPIPDEVMVEAREELREVMIQYTSCADPTESAARKERLRRAEEQGEVEKSTEQIARQLMKESRPALELVDTEPLATRVPVTQRLGPATQEEENVGVTLETGRVPARKRLGRPPTKKPLGVNTATAGSSGVAKRKVSQVRVSPKRRTS